MKFPLRKTTHRRTWNALERLEDRWVLDSTVVFNEIMFNPAAPDDTREWIELHNQMAVDMDLSEWSLRDGVEFEFPDGTVVPGGGYLVVASDPSSLQEATGLIGVLGPFTGRLSNGGERIRLVNNSNRNMNEIDYSDDGDWPVGPDGSGATLAKADPLAASDPAASWRTSAQIGGTPGMENFPSGVRSQNRSDQFDARLLLTETVGVMLPELVFHEMGASGQDSFFVEIRNEGSSAAELGGLVLVNIDTRAESQFVLPAQSLGPGEYLALDQAALGYAGAVGDRLVLYTADRSKVIDAGKVSDRLRGASSKHPGQWLYPSRPTPGGANEFAFVNDVVINEIQYHDAPQLASTSRTVASRPVPRFDRWRFAQPPGGLDGQTPTWFAPEFDDSSWQQATGPFGNSDHTAAILEARPLAYWRFEEDQGPNVVDSSSNGRNGVADDGALFGQPSLVQGDRALRLSRDVSVVVPAFEKFPEGSTGYTMEYWITVHSMPERSFDYLVSDGQAHNDYFVRNRLSRAGAIRASFNFARSLSLSSATALEPGRTYHIATTADVATGIASIYINGVLDASRDIDTSRTQNTDNPFFLGKSEAGDGGDFTLDEVAIYNRALSPLEVSAHFGAGVQSALDPGRTTHYLRNPFQFDGDPGRSEMAIDLRVDDGAVVYLNGVEVHRQNIPAGEINHQTPALAPVDTPGFSEPVPLDTALLRQGTNLLAVEVHQASPSGDDVFFDAELSLTRTTGVDADYVESAEEWIELFNRGTTPVDLTGWQLSDAIRFDFSEGQVLQPGQYLVVARDAEAVRADHPDVADRIIGNFSGRLADDNERIRLLDAHQNPADEVHYFDDKPWPVFADAGNSTLELRDADANNAQAEAWAASDESRHLQWQSYSYQGIAADAPNSSNPSSFHEFVFGLLGVGEVLIDDLHVIEEPNGAAIELIQNNGFDDGTTSGWRLVGNHHGSVVQDEGNNVLHLIATGTAEHLQNHVETTFKDGDTFKEIVEGREYRVSFRAKWLAGSRQLHSRFFFNLLPRTTLLDAPTITGTPGRQNSTYQANIGPTYAALKHEPVTPIANESIRVTVQADDPDGVVAATLWYSVDQGPWASAAMFVNGGLWQGSIPGQPNGSIIQFYVEGQDEFGARSTFPSAGPESRALVKVGQGPISTTGLHNFQIIMLADEEDFLGQSTNLMSNDRLGSSVIYQGRVYYDVGVRLKGSEHGRPGANRRGFSVRFHADDLFRGVHPIIGIDRSGGWKFGRQLGQDEILIYHFFNRAGDIPSQYSDLVFVDGPTVPASTAILQMARFDDVYFESQFRNGQEGTAYEYELIYAMQAVGGVEGLKAAQTGPSIAGVPVGADMGDDKEHYRQNFLIKNNRQRDDYAPLIQLAKAFSMSGDAFHNATRDVVDVDQWLRAYAALSLSGAADNYQSGAQHNAQFYQRPVDGRMLLLPFDMDFAFTEGSTSSLTRNGDLRKFLAQPTNEHHFLGHVHDIVQQSYNVDYMTRWVEHYESLLVDQPLGDITDYIERRAGKARAELPPNVDFATTSAIPLDVGDASTATITGSGWIDVRHIRVAGSQLPPDVTWTSLTEWEASIPVDRTTGIVTLEAYDFRDNLIGTDTVTIQSTAQNLVADSLRITEINYHPHAPTASERALDAALTDQDFEFIELMNISDQAIDLAGTQLVQAQEGGDLVGVSFDFANGAAPRLGPGERLVIVENLAAFELRYGPNVPLAGQWTGGLSNRGELLTLVAAGATVHQFSYSDAWYPETDGAGASLEIVDPHATDAGLWAQRSGWQPSAQLGGTPGHSPASGDFDGDGQISARDIDLLTGQVLAQSHERAFDLNGDGFVDQADVDVLVQDILATQYGDTNLDGMVDMTDFEVLAASFGSASGIWSSGDSDGDGDVDFADFVRLANNFEPEPAG